MRALKKLFTLVSFTSITAMAAAAHAETGYICGEKMLVFVDDSQSLAYWPVEGKRLSYCSIMQEMIESNIQCTSTITPQSVLLRIFASKSVASGGAKTIVTNIDRIAMRGTLKATGEPDVTENCRTITEAEFASRSNDAGEDVNFEPFQDDVPGKGYEVTVKNNERFTIRCTIEVKGTRQEGAARFQVDLSSVISVSANGTNAQSWRGIQSGLVESAVSCERA